MSGRNGQAKTERAPGRWWGMLSVFVDQRLRTISPVAACIWLVMFRNNRDGVVQIGQDHIAKTLGLKRRVVTKRTQELVDAGLIQVEVRGRRLLASEVKFREVFA